MVYFVLFLPMTGPCELYPYGPSSGDDDLWGSDTSTGKQYLSKPIFFYGKNENVIVVS